MMDLRQAVRQRHSVRRYLDRPIEEEKVNTLRELTETLNRQSGLHIQLVINEPKAFASALARYGRFHGVNSYFALVGPKGNELEEACGYYGEQLVLAAQCLGLNTCWAALTFRKVPDAFVIQKGEKLAAVIALGYGETQGAARRSKDFADISARPGPQWYRDGIEAVLLAPTAMNQQKFRFAYTDDGVRATAGHGLYTKMDLGIAKYHFEVGSGKPHSIWNKEKSE